MKNKNGQVLVAFVILLPIILILMGSIIEYALVRYNKVHLTSVIKTVIKETINEKDEDKINELLKENGIENADIKIDDGITISVNKSINSYLGKLINKDKYDININIKGYLDNNKVIYKKGS